MLRGITKALIRSVIKKTEPARKKNFVGWNDVQKVALILQKEDNINKSEVDRFVEDTGKFCNVYFIEPRSKQASFGDWECYTRKDWNFFRMPKKARMDGLKKKEYDVVINTCPGFNFHATALAGALRARMKCACSGIFQYADVVIHKTEGGNVMGYLNDTLKYLKMIRPA